MKRAGGHGAVAIGSASHRADGPVKTFARRVLRTSTAVMTAVLVCLALGAAFGRWQALPARTVGDGVSFDRGSLVLVEPTPALSLDEGDEIYVDIEGGERGFRRVVTVNDSWERYYEIQVDGGERLVIKLPETVWRVSHVVRYAGLPFAVFVGRIQSLLLVFAGLALIAWAELRRNRIEGEETAPPPDTGPPDAGPTEAASRVTGDTPVLTS